MSACTPMLMPKAVRAGAARQARSLLAALPGRAHLIGCQGSGMQSLAAVLAGAGWQLTGYDDALAGSAIAQQQRAASHEMEFARAADLHQPPDLMV